LNDVYGELARELLSKTDKRIAGATVGLQPELGTIMSNMSLKLDRFKHEIDDYKVADWTADIHFPVFSLVGTETSPVDEQGNSLPDATTSGLMRYDFGEKKQTGFGVEFRAGLKPGDRVLVIQVNGGQDFVVICKVVDRK